jgi:hypothetical protein
MSKDGVSDQGYLKPNTIKRRRLRHFEVPNSDETTWTNIEDKEKVKNHPITRNVEKFSHAGATLFGYTELGKELGHMGDSEMAEDIMNSVR